MLFLLDGGVDYMKRRKGLSLLTVLFLSFLIVTGCEKEVLSSDSYFLGFKEKEIVHVVDDKNNIITVEFENEVRSYSFGENIIVSPGASYKVYEDKTKSKEEPLPNISVGENKLYLEITAEDGITIRGYELIINRKLLHSVNYPEGEGYKILPIGTGDLQTKVADGETIRFIVEIEEGYELVEVTASGETSQVTSSPINHTYQINNIKNDITIIVDVILKNN